MLLEQVASVDVEGTLAILILDDGVLAELAYGQAILEGYDKVLIHNKAQATTNGDMWAMDRIIIRVALAEIVSFPDIPVSVSINEYVELTKVFSTPKSWRYVNGTLDSIVKLLTTQKKIVKNVK